MPTLLRRTSPFVVAALVLAACSGSTTKTSSSSPTATSVPTTTTTTTPSPDVSLLMLSTHDLPAGRSVNHDATSTGSFSCFASIPKRPAGELARAQVTFKRDDKTVSHFAETAAYFRPARAVAVYSTALHAFSGCNDVSITANGQRISGTIGALSIPPVGDASDAWQIKFSAKATGVTVTLVLDVLLSRVGNYDLELIASQIGTPDVTQFERLAARAASRFTGSSA